MQGIDAFRYEGKRALVVGGATGMGAAAAQLVASLGGEVVVMDHAPIDYPVAEAVKVDLQDRAAIDAALDQLGEPVDAVFSAAGIADGPALMRVNFIGHRYLIERLLAGGLLGHGGAICFIASVAGIGWEGQLPTLLDFLATPDFESADAWVRTRPETNNYMFAKQAINAYVARQALPLVKQGVRINAICPGPTDTPLARANAELWLAFAEDYRATTGLPTTQPSRWPTPWPSSTAALRAASPASTVPNPGDMVDRAEFRESLAHETNVLRLDLEGEGQTDPKDLPLYVILLHSRYRSARPEDRQFAYLPGSAYLAFPNAGCDHYLHTVNLFDRYADLVARLMPQEWDAEAQVRYFHNARRFAAA